jgi:hypothetical protein
MARALHQKGIRVRLLLTYVDKRSLARKGTQKRRFGTRLGAENAAILSNHDAYECLYRR